MFIGLTSIQTFKSKLSQSSISVPCKSAVCSLKFATNKS